MRKRKLSTARLLICVENKGYSMSLEKRKIYMSVPDPAAAKHDLVRVIDESGENYLCPKRFFLPITLPHSERSAVLEVS
jgi:hypothetical protein